MKTKLLLVILIGSFLVPNISMAAGYESNDFIISLYQGWDKLEEGRLVFGAPLYDHDDVYDFVKVQHNQTVNTGKNSFTAEELRELFEDSFTPVLFTIYAKIPVRGGHIYISHLYTENYALKPSLMRTWEYEYRQLPHQITPSSSIRISLPEKHLYKCVFLVPNELARETVYITIEDAYSFRQSVSSGN